MQNMHSTRWTWTWKYVNLPPVNFNERYILIPTWTWIDRGLSSLHFVSASAADGRSESESPTWPVTFPARSTQPASHGATGPPDWVTGCPSPSRTPTGRPLGLSLSGRARAAGPGHLLVARRPRRRCQWPAHRLWLGPCESESGGRYAERLWGTVVHSARHHWHHNHRLILVLPGPAGAGPPEVWGTVAAEITPYKSRWKRLRWLPWWQFAFPRHLQRCRWLRIHRHFLLWGQDHSHQNKACKYSGDR